MKYGSGHVQVIHVSQILQTVLNAQFTCFFCSVKHLVVGIFWPRKLRPSLYKSANHKKVGLKGGYQALE